ncbi:chemotaxis protein CheW [Roseovarius phycicola]|uniref:Chemotaxis protein CheW n=1 Tax=Roseovarius phycicola TaxID=3080976 RepID=A0ABZ2HHW4_9RHOB
MEEALLEDRTEERHEVVAFQVADQDFCFDLTSVREIRGWTETTMLPHAQPYVKGVINLRGSVVPVIDLSERLGLGATDPAARHVIIITVIGTQTVGLLADVVSDILSVKESDLHPIPDIIDEAVRAYVTGVLVIEGRMIRRLNLARILPSSAQDGR